jgi:hypothetical protein
VEEQDRATDKEREECMSTKHGRRWGRSCRLECMSLPFSPASHTSLSLRLCLCFCLCSFGWASPWGLWSCLGALIQ